MNKLKVKCKECGFKLYNIRDKKLGICHDCIIEMSKGKKEDDSKKLVSDISKSTVYITQDSVMQVCMDCLGVGETQYWTGIKICKNCKGTGMVKLNLGQNNRKKTFTFLK